MREPWTARTTRSLRAGAAVAVSTAVLSSCAVQTTALVQDPGTVRIALNGWVGYEASAEVLAHLLEEELDYEVQLMRLDEQPSWQALDQGVLDVIVENWGHEDLLELYGPDGNGTVIDGGPNGNEGKIGWYMPEYLVEEYPGINTLEGLHEHAEVFQTAETGDAGEFLAGDPGFVTQDQGMINAFDLDYEIVYAGSEAAQITEVRNRYANEEPVLFYFYEPQWLFNELDLVRVELPEYEEGCADDPEYVPCDYPVYDLNKIFRVGFAVDGGPAYQLVDNWTWTNADQNEVAGMIADEGMDPAEAAEEWANDNPDVWQEWIPDGTAEDHN
ncbi:ABC transporter substrate-binding protein [Lipingzhangella sp. LS1_29]|uniref:ABC transporter substrate-binding protein n=1 Tax=Lipingzhangella rawalii TaxID=2055835 RepID=A0ABU2H445_9ACTN|nr:ABC transporter substrate-binding protein [Lipingzhangella rawalii]MDS1270071.1 ABC transporter substrate-binding protein [Lipingzhangella rawalii]